MLNVLEQSRLNQRKLKQWQKAGGINLIPKYLANFCKHKKAYLINSIEEWKTIQNEFPEVVTVRVDAKIGQEIPQIGGMTGKKEKVIPYMKEAIEKVKEPGFLCMELEKNSGERVDTKGGFLIDAMMGGQVIIGYTGPCFDCRELTKGKAEHETWKIQWNEIPMVTAGKEGRYHIQTISQKAYEETAKERLKFLVKSYPEREEEILQKMPKIYQRINPKLIQKLLEEVLYPLYLKKNELLADGLTHFDIEMNILENGDFVAMEVCRPERFRSQIERKEGKEDGTR